MSNRKSLQKVSDIKPEKIEEIISYISTGSLTMSEILSKTGVSREELMNFCVHNPGYRDKITAAISDTAANIFDFDIPHDLAIAFRKAISTEPKYEIKMILNSEGDLIRKEVTQKEREPSNALLVELAKFYYGTPDPEARNMNSLNDSLKKGILLVPDVDPIQDVDVDVEDEKTKPKRK